MVESEQPSLGTRNVEADDSKTNNKSEEITETSKNKKKKKKNKSGRTVQEEDDLDKILAELGEGPTELKPAAPPPPEENVHVQPETVIPADARGEKEGEEEGVETAAAKKKKKKKEKEKEKKAAAAAAATAAATASADVKEESQEEMKIETSDTKKKDSKSKAADKKLPKHVREMQEALARRKEAEERKKKEEEERLRKEEEERRRQEELERQAEEARRRKKEREKEKLLKKKQEGKLLTGKQKEEARRLEAMRNQILGNKGGLPLPSADKDSAPTKRPIYQSKRSKTAHHHANGPAFSKPEEKVQAKEKQQEEQETKDELNTLEDEKVDEVESNNTEEKSVVADAAEESGMEEEDDDDGEWDEKSWDDVTLNVKGAFDDEEADSEPKPMVLKDIKSAASASRNAAPAAVTKPTVEAKKATASRSIKSQDDESKKGHPDVEAQDKNMKKNTGVKNKAPRLDAPSKQTEENLRSPICCIMGHVDTGKTKLLDCIRGTNVQEGEAGGITQQIGATYFPAENIRERTRELKADAKLKVAGLLVIDTPGHESFTNLRSRGSGLCDIAILVVDIMHGLEPQTIESLNLLKMRNTEFIVALNKVDRLYGWKVLRNAPILKSLKQQSKDVQNEFNMRLTHIITQFKEQGLNTELYYKNREMGETFSIVPTSAITGEGIPDLLLLLVQWAQKTMVEKLTFNDEVQCTVLEVKVIEGLGTTIDVVLVNGILHEGDQIVVCGLQGPIVTTVRALLTPHPMKELRVKGTYMQHKEIKAAMGIKIAAQNLEHAIAGTGLYVVGPDDDLEDVKEAVREDMQSVMNRIDKSGEGVYVQASTLGSLEALLEFLKTPEVNIPVSGIGIGPVHKKDVMKASVMLEKKNEYATILAFDVKVTPEARELADELGVRIFIADIIYHLFDQFKAYIDGLKEERKKEAADEAVFPCVLKILPNCIFNKKDPIVLGVDILEGIARVGTPICIPQREFIDIGRIASIENNHRPVEVAKKGQKVAIKIVGSSPEEQQKMYGRHFELEDELVSHISRRSIDVLKANYRDDLTLEEWKLVQRLKILFKIP
ncbi:eukaryotic translation initiation factor 5B-like [Herrania umbratica]|uniref:Eukaryotic translation initiation factor 5B n=1 Tax=Herrania umbratica TaxID=108875 RepID=A0A6J0ZHV9_9ROSI|nr:eukaryotic translation initiation factor 5B-like [Herrania umbratica]